MYSYERVVTRVCKRCGQSFQSHSRVEFYCDPCKPSIKKAAIARSVQKRAKKARDARRLDPVSHITENVFTEAERKA